MVGVTTARGGRGEGSLRNDLQALAVAGGAAGFAAFAAAQLGIKGLVVAAGVWALAVGMLAVRDRPLLVLLFLLFSLQAVVSKAFGPINTDVISGANTVYVTSFDALLVLLYLIWLLEGRLVADLRAAFRDRTLVLPLLAMLTAVPSLLVATDVYLSFAEIFQALWFYALFVYVAVRLQHRGHLAYVVGGLFACGLIQCVVVVLQWKTGGTLGLSFLGEAQTLDARSLDSGSVLRPSGTAIHPNILTPYVAPIGLLALSLALELGRTGLRLLCLFFAAIAVVPLLIAQTRAALVAAAVAAVVLIVAALFRGRLRWRWAFLSLGGGGAAVLFFWSWIQSHLLENLGSQFQAEISARFAMNGAALDMFKDMPLTGVGLNNFMSVIDRYDIYSTVVFPVHNLYLLVLSETGIFGVLGALLLGIGLLAAALRLSATGDRFLSGLGIAVLASYLFFAVEELLSFSLRIDMPMALLTVLAGMSLAAGRIAAADPIQKGTAAA